MTINATQKRKRFSFSLPFFVIQSVWAYNGDCPAGTEKAVIDFNKYSNGTLTKAGDFVHSDDWLRSGVVLQGAGVRYQQHRSHHSVIYVNDVGLRIFDSSKPTEGFSFLGSPNEGCTDICNDIFVSCSGVSTKADAEKAASTNCWPQGNILIFDHLDSRHEAPKPYDVGGNVKISFKKPVSKVLSIGLMNSLPHDDKWEDVVLGRNSRDRSGVRVYNSLGFAASSSTSSSFHPVNPPFEALGENTWQRLSLNIFDPFLISELHLDLYGPVGITHLEYCAVVPDDDHSICSNDLQVRASALKEIGTLSNEELVARYNSFTPTDADSSSLYNLGDCCRSSTKYGSWGRFAGQYFVEACGGVWPPPNRQGSEISTVHSGPNCIFLKSEYNEWDLVDRQTMCATHPVDSLAARLRHAVHQGACCRLENQG